MDKIEELKWLEEESVKVYMEYAEEAKRIWTNEEAVIADEKVQRLYSKYKSKQFYLDRLISMQKSVIEDMENYKNKYKL